MGCCGSAQVYPLVLCVALDLGSDIVSKINNIKYVLFNLSVCSYHKTFDNLDICV